MELETIIKEAETILKDSEQSKLTHAVDSLVLLLNIKKNGG